MKKRLSAFFLAFLMLLLSVNGVYASSTKARLSEAEKEMQELEKQLEDAKALISSLQGSKTDIEARVKELDTQLSTISGQIEELSAQLDEKNAEIEAAEVELAETEERLAEANAVADTQYEEMKLRIQYMYENSTKSDFLELFCTSGSITEFLSAVEYVYDLA